MKTTHIYEILKLTAFVTLIILLLLIASSFDLEKLIYRKEEYTYENNSSYIINTPGCQIPDFSPKSQFYQPFKHYGPRRIICEYNDIRRPFVLSDARFIWVDEEALKIYGVQKDENVTCGYEELFREEVISQNARDTRFSLTKTYTFFWKKHQVSAEYIRVFCKNQTDVIYRDYHAFVPLKRKVEERCRTKGEQQDKINVLILALDTVSRLNFYRTMKKTKHYIMNDMKAIEMLGYNKVGYGTFPNAVASLTGLNTDELSEVCLTGKFGYFDSCPFIWNAFRDVGYRTAFIEDASNIALFNYMLKGFQNSPTDYYWKPMIYAYERELGKRISNTYPCVGSRFSFHILLDYTRKFIYSMQNLLYFGIIWETSISHDFLLNPMLADKPYFNFLKQSFENNDFNNTVVIILSDHGYRWGAFRKTYQGMLEDSLPFLYFIFPTWFKEKYPLALENIQKNSHRLTTPYDLHETLNDLVNYTETLKEESLKKSAKNLTNSTLPRGISLFLPIPPTRTCDKAGIHPIYCTCLQRKKADITSRIATRIAHFVVDHLNYLLLNYVQCAQLELSGINNFMVTEVDIQTIIYTITLETIPGNGIFEASVRRKKDNYKIEGPVARTNTYGNTSNCVDGFNPFNLKLYCYCIS